MISHFDMHNTLAFSSRQPRHVDAVISFDFGLLGANSITIVGNVPSYQVISSCATEFGGKQS